MRLYSRECQLTLLSEAIVVIVIVEIETDHMITHFIILVVGEVSHMTIHVIVLVGGEVIHMTFNLIMARRTIPLSHAFELYNIYILVSTCTRSFKM